MSAKRKNISQINKYLQGKLDAKAMHQLERDAQDDPFLMDALEGYEKTALDQQANLLDLEGRLAKRIADEKKRSILLWRVLPIAASVLIMLGAGYSFFKSNAEKNQYANAVKVDNMKGLAANKPQAKDVDVNPTISVKKPQKPVSRHHTAGTPSNRSNPYAVNKNITNMGLPQKSKAMEADSNSRIMKNGNILARLNGKEYTSGDVKKAIKNIPADVVEKSQVIDDYGDQVAKVVAKNAAPIKASIYGRKDTSKLGDAVVRGYVKRNRDLTTGSSYIVTGKEVQDHPVANVEQLLQGKVAGLNIQNHSTTITGKVTDKEGLPMPGVSILNAKKVVGTTDINGQYRVAINKDSSLAFSSIGYSVQAIKLKPGQAALDVKLDVANVALAEIAIVPKKGNACIENIQFKNTFFADIAIVDRYVFEHAGGYIATITDKKFLNALKFIAARAPTSFKADNSAIGYANLKTFSINKTEWLKWYEANKCNNLK